MGKAIKTEQPKKMEARGKLSASYQFRTHEKPIYLFRGSLADEEEKNSRKKLGNSSTFGTSPPTITEPLTIILKRTKPFKMKLSSSVL